MLKKSLKISLMILVSWTLLFGFTQIGGSDPLQRCPLSGHQMVICQMNPTEHIQEWQSMFTMLPVESAVFAILALFAFFVVFTSKLWSGISLPDPATVYSQRFRARAFAFQIFDPLKEAFSSGILNPKLY